jgi:hypothetical protein
MPINMGEGLSDPQGLPEEPKSPAQQLVERVGDVFQMVQAPLRVKSTRQVTIVGGVLALAIAIGTGSLELTALAAASFTAGAVASDAA